MPLFGLRTTKKNEQSQIETAAGEAKVVVKKSKKNTKLVPAVAGDKVKTVEERHIAMPKGTFSSETEVILRPHVTEKSGILSQNGAYTFEVSRKANKQTVAKAVKALYKVSPIKVCVINIPPKRVFMRGKKGVVSGFRKAIVTLKKGDKIDFV